MQRTKRVGFVGQNTERPCPPVYGDDMKENRPSTPVFLLGKGALEDLPPVLSPAGKGGFGRFAPLSFPPGKGGFRRFAPLSFPLPGKGGLEDLPLCPFPCRDRVIWIAPEGSTIQGHSAKWRPGVTYVAHQKGWLCWPNAERPCPPVYGDDMKENSPSASVPLPGKGDLEDLPLCPFPCRERDFGQPRRFDHSGAFRQVAAITSFPGKAMASAKPPPFTDGGSFSHFGLAESVKGHGEIDAVMLGEMHMHG